MDLPIADIIQGGGLLAFAAATYRELIAVRRLLAELVERLARLEERGRLATPPAGVIPAPIPAPTPTRTREAG